MSIIMSSFWIQKAIPMARAGSIEINGPIYGINSIIAPMSASANVSQNVKLIQKNLAIFSQRRVRINIENDRISCHLSQKCIFEIILSSFDFRYFETFTGRIS